jgi:hypothetical protein
MKEVGATVTSLGVLLSSITVASRLPRLARRASIRWLALAVAILFLGVVACLSALPVKVSDFLAGPAMQFSFLHPRFGLNSGGIFLGSIALIIAAICWLLPPWPRLGKRVLIGVGALVIALAVWRAYDDPAIPSAPLWPIVLAALMFLYLWWLAILSFDLSFIWHRYIRNSVALDTLRDWRENKDTTSRTFGFREPKD